MTQVVSDVFAFACTDSEWCELLDEDGDLPGALVGEVDHEAFRAAARHVNDAAEALLRACFGAFRAAAVRDVPEDARFARLRDARRPQSRTLRQRWSVWAPLGSGAVHFLGVSLEADFDGRTRRLYAWVEGDDTTLDEFEANGETSAAGAVRDGAYAYLAELPIAVGDSFDGLAETLVTRAWPEVRRYALLLEAA